MRGLLAERWNQRADGKSESQALVWQQEVERARSLLCQLCTPTNSSVLMHRCMMLSMKISSWHLRRHTSIFGILFSFQLRKCLINPVVDIHVIAFAG